jgi:hypothetical protein
MIQIVTGKLVKGILLMASFIAILVGMFMPLFDGQTALDYLDNLFNSISKASAYYVPKLRHSVDEHAGKRVTLRLSFEDQAQVDLAATLLEHAGGDVSRSGGELEVSGAVDALLGGCLADADDLYHNRGDAIARRYQREGRTVIHGWWKVLSAMEKDLGRQKEFGIAELVGTIKAKAVECAYNYYGIEPQPIGQRWGTVLFSLVFYVIYTIWYGYAVMFLFEGLGFRLVH